MSQNTSCWRKTAGMGLVPSCPACLTPRSIWSTTGWYGVLSGLDGSSGWSSSALPIFVYFGFAPLSFQYVQNGVRALVLVSAPIFIHTTRDYGCIQTSQQIMVCFNCSVLAESWPNILLIWVGERISACSWRLGTFVCLAIISSSSVHALYIIGL